jgi:hypothetical protein
MTQDAPRNPNDHLASGPRRNVQFGQKIGVDDTSPPEVAHGQRVAEESRTVDDPLQGERVRFVRPLDHQPPAQEVTRAAGPDTADVGPQDVGLPEAGPSVWDASKEEGEPSP